MLINVERNFIMKKILSLLLVLTMISILCACGGDEGTTMSLEDEACGFLRTYVMVRIGDEYRANLKDITYNVDETSENTFEISGKITFSDEYDDIFTKNYDATVTYNPNQEDFDIVGFEMH